MKIGEQPGDESDLLENINGGIASLIYLSDSDPARLAKKYNDIRAAKQILTGYYDSGKSLHVLCVFIDGKIKFK